MRTHNAVVLGTPEYMAPEQATGENQDLDQRADVFAVGGIVYEMLTGERAFDGVSLAELTYRIVYGPTPPLGERAPWLPQSVVAAVARALEKSRERRFADLPSFAEALGELAGTAPGPIVKAAPPAPPAPGAATAKASPRAKAAPPGGTLPEDTAPPPGAPEAPRPGPAPAPAGRRGRWILGLTTAAVLAAGAAWLLWRPGEAAGPARGGDAGVSLPPPVARAAAAPAKDAGPASAATDANGFHNLEGLGNRFFGDPDRPPTSHGQDAGVAQGARGRRKPAAAPAWRPAPTPAPAAEPAAEPTARAPAAEPQPDEDAKLPAKPPGILVRRLAPQSRRGHARRELLRSTAEGRSGGHLRQAGRQLLLWQPRRWRAARHQGLSPAARQHRERARRAGRASAARERVAAREGAGSLSRPRGHGRQAAAG